MVRVIGKFIFSFTSREFMTRRKWVMSEILLLWIYVGEASIYRSYTGGNTYLRWYLPHKK
jgi:hypothetical protein